MTVLYTAKATSTNREGTSKSESGVLDLKLGKPGGKATNPEELFACGYSACFGSALESVAKSEKVELKDAKVTAEVDLNKEESGYSISARLNISASGIDDAKLRELVNKAHQVCPYSKATRGNIEVTFSVNSEKIKAAA